MAQKIGSRKWIQIKYKYTNKYNFYIFIARLTCWLLFLSPSDSLLQSNEFNHLVCLFIGSSYQLRRNHRVDQSTTWAGWIWFCWLMLFCLLSKVLCNYQIPAQTFSTLRLPVIHFHMSPPFFQYPDLHAPPSLVAWILHFTKLPSADWLLGHEGMETLTKTGIKGSVCVGSGTVEHQMSKFKELWLRAASSSTKLEVEKEARIKALEEETAKGKDCQENYLEK